MSDAEGKVRVPCAPLLDALIAPYRQPAAIEARRADLLRVRTRASDLNEKPENIAYLLMEIDELIERPTYGRTALLGYDWVISAAEETAEPVHVVAEIVSTMQRLRAEHHEYIATHIYPEPPRLHFPEPSAEAALQVAMDHLDMLRSAGEPVCEVDWCKKLNPKDPKGKKLTEQRPLNAHDSRVRVRQEAVNHIDHYISVNEFKKSSIGKWRNSRRKQDVRAIRTFHVELDFNKDKPPEQHLSIAEAREQVLQICRTWLLPYPTRMNTSGSGGIHVYWVLRERVYLTDDPAKRKAILEAYDHVQSILVAIFKSLEGDNNAKDAMRVLRIPGSLRDPDANGNQAYCWPVYITNMLHDFEEFEEAIRAYTGPIDVAGKKSKPDKPKREAKPGDEYLPKAEAAALTLKAIPVEIAEQLDALKPKRLQGRDAFIDAKLRDVERIRWGLHGGKFHEGYRQFAIFIVAALNARHTVHRNGWQGTTRRWARDACPGQPPDDVIQSVQGYLGRNELTEIHVVNMADHFRVTDEFADLLRLEVTGHALNAARVAEIATAKAAKAAGSPKPPRPPRVRKPKSDRARNSYKQTRVRYRTHFEQNQAYLVPEYYDRAWERVIEIAQETRGGTRDAADKWLRRALTPAGGDKRVGKDRRDGLVQAYFEGGRDEGILRTAIADPKAFVTPYAPQHVPIRNRRKAVPLRLSGGPAKLPMMLTPEQKRWRPNAPPRPPETT